MRAGWLALCLWAGAAGSAPITFNIALPVHTGGGPGEFHAPGGVAVAANGDLFVADFYNQRIQKFSADGAFLTSFGGQRSGAGQFNHAFAVAVADEGMVFAVDFGNNRVEKWRPATPITDSTMP